MAGHRKNTTFRDVVQNTTIFSGFVGTLCPNVQTNCEELFSVVSVKSVSLFSVVL